MMVNYHNNKTIVCIAIKSKKWYLLDGVDEADTQEIVETFFEMFPTTSRGKTLVLQ